PFGAAARYWTLGLRVSDRRVADWKDTVRRVPNTWSPTARRPPNSLVEQGIEQGQLHPERVAISAVPFFLVAIERFQSKTESLSRLPHQISAGVMRHVIGIRPLRELIIQMNVPITYG